MKRFTVLLLTIATVPCMQAMEKMDIEAEEMAQASQSPMAEETAQTTRDDIQAARQKIAELRAKVDLLAQRVGGSDRNPNLADRFSNASFELKQAEQNLVDLKQNYEKTLLLGQPAEYQGTYFQRLPRDVRGLILEYRQRAQQIPILEKKIAALELEVQKLHADTLQVRAQGNPTATKAAFYKEANMATELHKARGELYLLKQAVKSQYE